MLLTSHMGSLGNSFTLHLRAGYDDHVLRRQANKEGAAREVLFMLH